jgi:hypothetical protein
VALTSSPLAPASAADAGPDPRADRARARQWLAEAAQVAGRIGDAGPRAGVWADIAGAQARAGGRAAAEALARQVGNPGWRAVADGLAAAGDAAGAVAAARRIQASGALEQWVERVVGVSGRDVSSRLRPRLPISRITPSMTPPPSGQASRFGDATA